MNSFFVTRNAVFFLLKMRLGINTIPFLFNNNNQGVFILRLKRAHCNVDANITALSLTFYNFSHTCIYKHTNIGTYIVKRFT